MLVPVSCGVVCNLHFGGLNFMSDASEKGKETSTVACTSLFSRARVKVLQIVVRMSTVG